MFSNLTKLSYKRTWLQAIGFYIAYFILLLLVGGLIGVIAGVLFSQASDLTAWSVAGQRGGVAAVTIFPPVLSFLILKAKKRLNNFAFLSLAVLSGIMGAFGGAFLGLIPVSFLTTR